MKIGPQAFPSRARSKAAHANIAVYLGGIAATSITFNKGAAVPLRHKGRVFHADKLMNTTQSSRLFASANWVMMLAIVGALLAAQWKHQAVPLVVLLIILVLTVIKSRFVILDFMGLRSEHPTMAAALWAWPVFFCIATLGRALSTLWVG